MKAGGPVSADVALSKDSALLFFIIYFSLLLLRMNFKSIGLCGFAFNAPQLDGKEWAKKKEKK